MRDHFVLGNLLKSLLDTLILVSTSVFKTFAGTRRWNAFALLRYAFAFSITHVRYVCYRATVVSEWLEVGGCWHLVRTNVLLEVVDVHFVAAVRDVLLSMISIAAVVIVILIDVAREPLIILIVSLHFPLPLMLKDLCLPEMNGIALL
jgi:hypothetical protein